MVLYQKEDPCDVKLCYDNCAETGPMSECITVLISTRNGNLYGVHCAGGLSDERVDDIVNSFTRTGEQATGVLAIFGLCYQDATALEFLGDKFDLVRNIAVRLATVHAIASASNAIVELENGCFVPRTELKLWTPHNEWTSNSGAIAM